MYQLYTSERVWHDANYAVENGARVVGSFVRTTGHSDFVLACNPAHTFLGAHRSNTLAHATYGGCYHLAYHVTMSSECRKHKTKGTVGDPYVFCTGFLASAAAVTLSRVPP